MLHGCFLKTLEVSDSLTISLDYTLRLDDGEIADTSEGRTPVKFIQGKGQIIPGLEKAPKGTVSETPKQCRWSSKAFSPKI